MVTCLALPAGASAAVAKPDLVADPPENAHFETHVAPGEPARRLLRFDGHVHNAGAGALEVRRSPTALAQRLLDPADRSVFADLALDFGRMRYENTDGHNHFHLQRVARYSLWADGVGLAAPAMKVGFCLLDSTRISGSVPPRYESNCASGQPNATNVTMGVSSGWRDLYSSDLPFQWVDVSHTVPGVYKLRSEMDPDDLLDEAVEADPPGERPVTVPGWVQGPEYGRPPEPGTLQGSSFALNPAKYGAPGPAQFTTVVPPAHGEVQYATGEPGLTYWPDDPDDPRSDRFVVAASDGSGYPRTPIRATFILDRPDVANVALSGVPGAVVGGSTTDLHADVFGVPGTVAWSVNGIAGGDATVGTITAGGHYRAPRTVPPAGKVRIRARVQGGEAYDEMDVAVLPGPPEEPAPSVPDDDGGGVREPADTTPEDTRVAATETTVTPLPPRVDAPATVPSPSPASRPRRRAPVGAVRAARTGPFVAVAVVPSASGRLRVSLVSGRRSLRSCSVRVRTGRRVVCRFRGASADRRLVLTLRRADGRTETKRLTVRAALRARS